jgi:hypothetical protein
VTAWLWNQMDMGSFWASAVSQLDKMDCFEKDMDRLE